MAEKWALVKHAGYSDEQVISVWSTYDDAWCAYQEQYDPYQELHFDIMKWDEEQSDWTTEY